MLLCELDICSESIPKSKYLIKEDNPVKKNLLSKIDLSSEINILDNGILESRMKNLVSPGDGYLCDVYNIECENVDWLTGWEISKIMHRKIIDESDEGGFKIYGYFGNTGSDFITGYTYYILSMKNKDNLKYQYFIYDKKIINLHDKLKNNAEYLNHININYIDTIEYDNLDYNSSSICRYVHNYIKKHALYLNFAIISNNNTDITNAMHSLLNINKDFGTLLVSIPWLIVNEMNDKKNMHSVDDSVYMYIYTLSCIFEKIKTLWFLWDNKIWLLCDNRREEFTKKKWINMINSSGYSLKKIQTKYSKEYNNAEKTILVLHENIITTKDKIICDIIHSSSKPHDDKENFIRQWLHENEAELKTLSEV